MPFPCPHSNYKLPHRSCEVQVAGRQLAVRATISLKSEILGGNSVMKKTQRQDSSKSGRDQRSKELTSGRCQKQSVWGWGTCCPEHWGSSWTQTTVPHLAQWTCSLLVISWARIRSAVQKLCCAEDWKALSCVSKYFEILFDSEELKSNTDWNGISY